MKKISILFCILFLISCSPASSPTSEQSIPSSAPVISPTTFVFPMSTPSPYPISTPTAKPTSISEYIPVEYDLPEWLRETEATIGMMISGVSKDIYKLSFLNLGTKDTYAISISTNLVMGYFWTPDGTHFGFVSSDKQTVVLVNLRNGKVEQAPIPKTAARFLREESQNSIEPLIVYGNFPDNFSFLSLFHSEYSADLRYVARQDYQIADNPPVVIEELETGQITQITHPSEGLYDYQYSWSPVISQLAILRGVPVEGRGGMMIPAGDRIEIYKPDGEKVASFEGSFTSPVWSSDGTKILYRETSSISPCILDINSATKRCLREIERKHSSANAITSLSWSKDESQIYYLYSGIDESGLCVYNLINGNDFCPTQGLSELEKLNVERYKVSSDERFFVFHFGGSCASCDYWDDPTVGVIGMDGTNFYTIGKEYLLSTSYTFSYPMGTLLWRPKSTFMP